MIDIELYAHGQRYSQPSSGQHPVQRLADDRQESHWRRHHQCDRDARGYEGRPFPTKEMSMPFWFPRQHTDLDSADTSQGPQVTIADPRELCLDFLHEIASNVETIVRAVKSLRLETHSGIVAMPTLDCESQRCQVRQYSPSTRVGLLVVRARRVPGKSQDNGAIRAV